VFPANPTSTVYLRAAASNNAAPVWTRDNTKSLQPQSGQPPTGTSFAYTVSAANQQTLSVICYPAIEVSLSWSSCRYVAQVIFYDNTYQQVLLTASSGQGQASVFVPQGDEVIIIIAAQLGVIVGGATRITVTRNQAGIGAVVTLVVGGATSLYASCQT
jgi:hypothetical protein